MLRLLEALVNNNALYKVRLQQSYYHAHRPLEGEFIQSKVTWK